MHQTRPIALLRESIVNSINGRSPDLSPFLSPSHFCLKQWLYDKLVPLQAGLTVARQLVICTRFPFNPDYTSGTDTG